MISRGLAQKLVKKKHENPRLEIVKELGTCVSRVITEWFSDCRGSNEQARPYTEMRGTQISGTHPGGGGTVASYDTYSYHIHLRVRDKLGIELVHNLMFTFITA